MVSSETDSEEDRAFISEESTSAEQIRIIYMLEALGRCNKPEPPY